MAQGLSAFFPLVYGKTDALEVAQGVIGTVVSGAVPVMGSYGPVYNFPASGSITYPSSVMSGITGEVTLSFLIKPTNLTNYSGIISKTSANIPAPLDVYGIISTGIVRFYRGDGGSNFARCESASPLVAGTWQHWVITATAISGNTFSAKFYLNGVLDKNATPDTTIAAAADSNNTVYVGTRADGVTQLNGSLAAVGLWNRQLSAGEAAMLARNPFLLLKPVPILIAATDLPAVPNVQDLPPKAAPRLVEYPQPIWAPRVFAAAGTPTPSAFVPVFDALPPRAAQRLVEYPSFFWGPRIIPAPAVTYASSFYDLPPKVAQRLAVYEAAWWNPARFVDAAPPAFAIPVLTDLPPVLQAPRRLVEYQAQFWNPLGGPFNGPPPAFAIPPGMDAANPRAAARLSEYAAAFWDPRLVVNAAPPAFSIPSFTDVPKVAARPAFYEQPAWTPQPFDIRYASVFDQLPPYAQKQLVEYQATFLALPVPPPPVSTPTALWQPQYPDLLLPAARLPDYSFFVLPYADYGGSITPPPDASLPQPIYGFWINARKRARHIAKQTNVKAAINQEINRALADLKEHDAAATERAFSRILAAEAVLQQQKYLKGLLEAHALETRLVAARRAAELAQEEQDINDLLGAL